MRLVKITLRNRNSFWHLNPIMLNSENHTSPFLDIDKLQDIHKEVINNSIKNGNILLINEEGDYVNGLIEDVNIFCGAVDPNDEEVFDDDDEYIKEVEPQIMAIQDDDSNVESEIQKIIEDNYMEDAVRFLKKNGNALKKIILGINLDQSNIELLKVCLKVEKQQKNRKSVIGAIEDVLGNV